MVRLSFLVALWTLFAVSELTAAAPFAPRTDRHGDPLPPGAVARLGTTRWRSAGGMRHLVAHPDGKHVLSSDGQRLAFWELRTGRRTRIIEGEDTEEEEEPFGLTPALTPDGKKLVSAS